MIRLCLAALVSLVICQSAYAGTTKLIETDAIASAISADGRFVLYNQEGSPHLYVIGTGQKIPIAGIGGGISANGRFVVGVSKSPLVSNDTNNTFDTYVLDRNRNIFTRVSVSSTGRQANRDISFAQSAISANGRFVAFTTEATNLVPGDTNRVADAFLHDLQTGETERVSVDGAERQWSKQVLDIAMSASGRFIAMSTFEPPSARIFPIFIRDRQLGTTTQLPIAFNKRLLEDITRPSISADGRFVAFIARDQFRGHAFVFDRQNRTMEQVDISTTGTVANSDSQYAKISPDGRFVAFHSWASNLVPGGSGTIFVRDRKERNTRRVSLPRSPGSWEYRPLISAGGRFVVISAINLDEETFDFYIHDRAGR